MIALHAYEESFRDSIVEWAADFFGFHASLTTGSPAPDLAQAGRGYGCHRHY